MATLRLSGAVPPRAPPPAPSAREATRKPVQAQPKSQPKTPRERFDRRAADVARLREQFPSIFDINQPKPLALGIDIPLRAILSRRRADRVLRWWCRHPAYRAAIAAGGVRYTLDGTVAEEITPEERAQAQKPRTSAAPPPA